MKALSKYYFLLLISLYPCQGLLSQNAAVNKHFLKRGYIITNSRDTVKGFVDFPNLYGINPTIRFRQKGSREIINYFPLDIAGSGQSAGRIIYRPVPVPTPDGYDLNFIKLLFDGQYDFLYFESWRMKHFLFQGPDEKVTEVIFPDTTFKSKENKGILPRQRFKESLNSVFPEIDNQKSLYRRLYPNSRSVVRFMAGYSKKTGQSYERYDIPEIANLIGIYGGISFDNMSLPVLSSAESSSEPAPYLGLAYHYLNINSGIGGFLESSITRKSFHYFHISDYDGDLIMNETFLRGIGNVTRLGMTVMPRLPFRIKPFVEAGGIALTFIDQDYDNYIDIIGNDLNTVYSYHDKITVNSRFFAGFSFRGGLSLALRNYDEVQIRGGYDMFWGDTEKISSVAVSGLFLFNPHKDNKK